MITEGIEDAVERVLYREGDLDARKKEMLTLIRAEAINLADKIIGKDRVLHADTDLKEGVMRLDREDKAVFDFQVQQRIKLAQYQNPQTGPVINNELSENEA
jgi:hypothetical protein